MGDVVSGAGGSGSFEAVGVSPASLDDCDPSQECHYCGHYAGEHGLDGACVCDVLTLLHEWRRCSCKEFQPRRCRDCFCVSDDHNNDEAGGGCTSCGDCEGWL